MHITTDAIVCSVRHHGEHGVIARLFTPDDGLLAGYVRGGRSTRMRPILMPGNAVSATFRSRSEDQLASLTVELVHSRGPLLSEPLAAAAMDWATTLTAAALPEGQGFPALYSALSGVLAAIELSPAARGWAAALARYEVLMLQSLGFGLALDHCTVTGSTDDLAFVSRKSAAAVSRSAAIGYEARLLPLPAFLRDGSMATLEDAMAGLHLSGHFIETRLFETRRSDLLAVRERLIDRLQRAIT
jgi:DNA repair protein RecO (recombination protein O)